MLFMLCAAQPFFALGRQEKAPSEPQAIKVLLADHPYGDLVKSRVHEFEEATGISVTVEQLKEAELRSGSQLTLRAGTRRPMSL